MVAYKAACQTLSKGFLKSIEHATDSVVVGETFHTGSKADDLFCATPPGSEPSLFFSNYLFGVWF